MFVPLTPLRCLARAADLFGARRGVVDGDCAFSYTQFAERCWRLASALPKLGIRAGDRVAYLSFNTHALLEGYFGVPQARAILLPLNVRLSEAELSAIGRDAEPRLLICEDEFAQLAQRLAPRIICIGAEYEALLNTGQPEPPDIMSIDELAIAELFYTSGSTGTPKGVMLSHRTLYLHALDYALQYRHAETMVDLHTIPLYHANGWGRPQASTMLGTKQILVRRFEPRTVFELVAKHRATDMCLVPTMANMLLNSPDRERYDLSSLRHINLGGAPGSPGLVARMERAFPACECSNGYGLTETSPVITHSEPREALWHLSDEARFERQSKTGWSLPGMTLRVVDAEKRDVPRDGASVGEIVAMGDHVMDGYFGDPEATCAAMTGPWLHTGDMAVWEPDGYIRIVDRKKQIIVSGGENISSIEVEIAIAAHPSVAECAVVAAPDERWGEVPAAVISLKQGAQLSETELLAFLEPRLARFKRPRIVEITAEPLPKSGTGKIRKLDLRERFWPKLDLGERSRQKKETGVPEMRVKG